MSSEGTEARTPTKQQELRQQIATAVLEDSRPLWRPAPEQLPQRFHQLLPRDICQADACFILGTSLQVAPVNQIPNMVRKSAKRLLLNREWVGNDVLRGNFVRKKRMTGSFLLRKNNNNKKQQQQQQETVVDKNDIFVPGDCDESVQQLSKLLGWERELQVATEKVQAR